MPVIFREEGYALFAHDGNPWEPVRKGAAVAQFCLDAELSVGMGDQPRHHEIAA
ncbi:hypothetical protein [Acidithiobacillus marinus]|uniref:hypothetical protein n=1 Tax=Acidithiobacillus marinus TaxID=187490 RepID=UPI0015555900|nr:hypothetical protein [Acidithiobacillus marinus]